MQAALQPSPVAPIPPPPALLPPADRFKWKRHVNHVRALRRIGVRPTSPPNSTLARRVASWLFPWTVHTYPGLNRGILAVLTRSITVRAIEQWREGKRPLPLWAAQDLRAHIRQIITQGELLIAEIDEMERADAKRIKRIDRGFCVTRAARHNPAPGDPL
jgi:hypothetical protein